MLILVASISPRLVYVFDFVFAQILQIPYSLCMNLEEFERSQDPIKWSYGVATTSNIPCLAAHGLLNQSTIEFQQTTKIVHKNLIALFENDQQEMDLFASIFYLVSRYEEYLPSVQDAHGRYAYYQSIAFQYQFLDIPMVNRYVEWIRVWLETQFKDLTISKPKSTIQITIDIDHPFYKEGIGLTKYIKRCIKDLFSSQEGDLYDTFDWISENSGDFIPLYFVLCPENPSKNDHLQHREHSAFKELVWQLNNRHTLGIHPSYLSTAPKMVLEEIQWLSNLTQKPITKNRFHYLRFSVENILNRLQKTAIQEDFSMAYGNISGFRSSCAFPFYFFDLTKNKATNLKIWTPCIMDSTFEYSEEVDKYNLFKRKSTDYLSEIKQYGGTFIPIFHNDILSKNEWKQQYIQTINSVHAEV